MKKHWTERYVGVPYVEFGRSIDGCDCWGLAWLVYRDELGIDLPSYAEGYSGVEERAEISGLIGDAQRNATWLRQSADIRPYDIAVFRRGTLDSHIGIVCAEGRMLHMVGQDIAKIEVFTAGYWAPRLTGIFRHFEMMAR